MVLVNLGFHMLKNFS